MLLAKIHLSNEASEPVGEPSKMYSNPGSGGGATYCAPAEAGTSAMAAIAMHPVTSAKRRVILPFIRSSSLSSPGLPLLPRTTPTYTECQYNRALSPVGHAVRGVGSEAILGAP